MSLPIALFTDFTLQGPYVGQMSAVLGALAPQSPLIQLMHDAPRMRPDLAAYLLPRVCSTLSDNTVVVAVVDPGVGSARRAIIVETDRATFVGPDNGLLSRLDGIRRIQQIDWVPPSLSASFHGRDLFAPVAARIAQSEPLSTTPLQFADLVGSDWPAASGKVIYIDGFGNLMTGVDLKKASEINRVMCGGSVLPKARTFSDRPSGQPFWYQNSLGLLEIAINNGCAAQHFGLALGDEVSVE